MTPLPLWRVLFAEDAGRALDGAKSPEGRFHHGGQSALYASLSAEGPSVSLTRYLREDDPPRVVVRLALTGANLAWIDPEEPDGELARARWDLSRADGTRPVTWDLSDRLRGERHDGFIYPSRLRPDLRNIVLFRWNTNGAPSLHLVDGPSPWVPREAPGSENLPAAPPSSS